MYMYTHTHTHTHTTHTHTHTHDTHTHTLSLSLSLSHTHTHTHTHTSDPWRKDGAKAAAGVEALTATTGSGRNSKGLGTTNCTPGAGYTNDTPGAGTTNYSPRSQPPSCYSKYTNLNHHAALAQYAPAALAEHVSKQAPGAREAQGSSNSQKSVP